MTPREQISAWLPHAFLLLLLAGAAWLLGSVLSPLRDPLLLAMAVAAMTYSLVYQPIEQRITQLLPRLKPSIRKQICGPLSTCILIFITLTPLLLIMFSTIASPTEAFSVLIGVSRQDTGSIYKVARIIADQAVDIHRIYPKLPIDPSLVHQEVINFLTNDVQLAFMDFLKKGSSSIAELILAVVSLSFFYSHGPRLVKVFLEYTPLSSAQQDEMARHHFQVIQRLLTDTIGTALAKGVALGAIAWMLTGTSFLLVATLAGFMSLLPIVGLTMVWLPLAALSWGNEHYLTAITIVLLSLICNYAVNWLRNKLGRKLHDRDEWTSFFLFLGLIGGIISFGLKGFLIGPMVVVLIATIGRFWLPLYGFRRNDNEGTDSSALTDEQLPDPATAPSTD